ncbi:MAG: hypothetical protein AB8B69_07105 [Chitinophagales bacterium]
MLSKRYFLFVSACFLLSNCSPKITVQNPFTQENADLPYYTEECSTEFPYFLGREWVQAEIASILKQKGISLEQGYLFQKDSVSVVLDGYDPKNRMGYIWINEDNLEFDLVDYSWIEEESILKEVQESYESNPNENLSFSEAEYFFEKQRKGELFIALINNFNPTYNLDFYDLKGYRDSPKMERKYHQSDDKDYYDSVAKFKRRELAKKMKNLVRDVKRYVDWVGSND